jgi:hypothetical protein
MLEKLLEKQNKLQQEVLELRKIIKEKNVKVLNDLLYNKEMELKSVSQDIILLNEDLILMNEVEANI